MVSWPRRYGRRSTRAICSSVTRRAATRGRRRWSSRARARGSVLGRKGGGLGYYLNSAGGFAPAADKGTVSVRYANGRVHTRVRTLFYSSDPKPEPGSEVFVPTRAQGPRTEILPLLATISQMLATLVTIIVVTKK